MNGLTSDAGRDIKTLGDVAVFGLALQAAVSIGLGAGERHALADLNQCRLAFAGLYLLHTAFTAGGAAVDDAGLAGDGAVDRVALRAAERRDGKEGVRTC